MPKNKKKPSNIFKPLIFIAVILAVAFGIYSVKQFQSSEENIAGFFTCNEEGTVCEQLQHIHADIEISVCGKEIAFPKEKGRTDRAHTHKEGNKIHWESSLQVNPKTRIPLDPSPLTIEAFLEQIEFAFPKTCPENPKPKLSVSVNGESTPLGLGHIWQDDDMIKMEYK